MSNALSHSVLVLLATAALAPAGNSSTGPALDESLFREGLRERGLTDWLQQYLADTPTADVVDARLREREKLLEQAASAPPGPQRQRLIEQAHRLLADLPDAYPDHPGRLRWRFELARDFLERIDPAAFDAILLYEVPGNHRRRAFELSGRAVEMLTRLREEVAAAWKSIEALDEASLQAAIASGSLRLLESLDGRSAYLLAWAEFCRLMSGDLSPADRRARMQATLAEVAQGSGWIQSPDPVQRCGAMVMAAVSARLAEEYDQADQFSLQIVNAYQRAAAADDRARLRTASLVAVIEQIRTLRDRGRADEALAYVEQSRRWAEQSRPNDIQAALAVAWVHHTVLVARYAPTSRPAGLLQPEEALDPLDQFARRSPGHRDALYAVLAGAIDAEAAPSPRTPFGMQLLLGAILADQADLAATQPAASQPADNRRIESVIAAARSMLGTLPADIVPEIRGEFLYLLGLAHQAAGRPLEAVAALCDLAEQQPGHDRSPRAAACAVAIAERLIRDAQPPAGRAARDAFIRAGRLLCRLSPDTPTARALPFYIAITLEQNGQLEAAAETYATVAADSERSLAARLGRARCLGGALDQAIASKTLSDDQIRQLADRAIHAARQAAAAAGEHKGDPARQQLAAETVVLLAGLLNHPMIDKSPEALALLQDFEQRFADQRPMSGSVWRERVAALTRLGRFAEARQAAGRCLAADPERAGPILDQLLEAMHGAIDAALDRDDRPTAIDVASEAVAAGNMLLEWAESRPQRVSPAARLSIRLRQAAAMLQAGQAKEALAVYQECHRTAATLPADSTPTVEIRLGQAESLLATGDAAAALPLFLDVWQTVPERSANWWRALSGSLTCHTRLGHDPQEILQAIRQQRTLASDLGGARWRRALETIERENQARVGEGRMR